MKKEPERHADPGVQKRGVNFLLSMKLFYFIGRAHSVLLGGLTNASALSPQILGGLQPLEP